MAERSGLWQKGLGYGRKVWVMAERSELGQKGLGYGRYNFKIENRNHN